MAEPAAGLPAHTALTGRPGEVWLVVGVQGAGKSTTAEALARRFETSVHVRGGQFYRFAVNGWEHPTDGHHTPEVRRLLDLRYQLAAQVASGYAAAGFTAVVQDNIFGADVRRFLDQVDAPRRHLVVLRPRVEVVARRDAERQASTGKRAYRPGEATVADLDAALAQTPAIGLWLDTSEQTPEETVDEILDRHEDARIA